MVDMTTKESTYGIPNVGCLLGIAYQTEVARLTQALAEANLDVTAAEYLILRVLFNHDKIQQCDIGKILVKDKASISRGVQSLAKKGYVDATPVSYKCSIISLTEEGYSLKQPLLEVADKLHQTLSSKITHEQMQKLREILELIIK